MKCTIRGCPGEYEDKVILHTVRRGDDVLVFEHVPADVCSVCGDVLLRPETVERLEKLVEQRGDPEKFVPLYDYA